MVTSKQIKAVIIGHAVDDALGVPAEFCGRDTLRARPVTDMRGYGTHPVPAGAWSDDTSMSLTALDSLIEKGVDYNDMMQRFAKWFLFGKYTPTGEVFDIGFSCMKAIRTYLDLQDRSALLCGGSAETENGNGSLMRINPICLFLYAKGAKKETAIEIVHNVSALTHAHARSKVACGIYAYVLWELLKNPCKQSAVNGLSLAENDYFVKKVYGEEFADERALRECISMRSLEIDFQSGKVSYRPQKEESIASDGYVVNTLDAAIWCLITTASYEECVLKAVNLGDDTDTMAAVAGGLAGALYGYNAIPQEWKNTLLKREDIEELCAQAVAAWQA